MKPFLLRGALAGAIAGVLAFVALIVLGEPSIRDAIAIEDAAARAARAVGDEPLFSRDMQVLGGSLGVMIFGVLLGTIFGVVFAAVRHWLGSVSEWTRALRLAGLGFLVVYLVPFLKYPPNPPAVGDPETVNQRTIAYLGLIAIAVIATVVAARFLARRRAAGWPSHVGLPAAVVLWIVMIGVATAVMPGNADPIRIGAKLIWRFRLASLGGQVAFWATLGTVFGWLGIRQTGRKVFGRTPADRAPEEPVLRGG